MAFRGAWGLTPRAPDPTGSVITNDGSPSELELELSLAYKGQPDFLALLPWQDRSRPCGWTDRGAPLRIR